jgi:Lrp/AsnC family transcriptional regulator, leucine-responsive regulatory protein
MWYIICMIDDIDRKIVSLLQANAHLSNAEMALSVGLTASSVFERVKKLEQRGVITGYVAKVDPAKLGKPLLAFMRLTLGATQSDDVTSALSLIGEFADREPDILECYDVAGEDCLILKLRAAGPPELRRLIASIRDCTKSARTITSLVLGTIKEKGAIEPAVEAKERE